MVFYSQNSVLTCLNVQFGGHGRRMLEQLCKQQPRLGHAAVVCKGWLLLCNAAVCYRSESPGREYYGVFYGVGGKSWL